MFVFKAFSINVPQEALLDSKAGMPIVQPLTHIRCRMVQCVSLARTPYLIRVSSLFPMSHIASQSPCLRCSSCKQFPYSRPTPIAPPAPSANETPSNPPPNTHTHTHTHTFRGSLYNSTNTPCHQLLLAVCRVCYRTHYRTQPLTHHPNTAEAAKPPLTPHVASIRTSCPRAAGLQFSFCFSASQLWDV